MADEEKLFRVNVVTPAGIVYSHRCSIINMRAIDGQREILYGHTPLLTSLVISELRLRRSKEMNRRVDHVAIGGGYIEFLNNVATVIVSSAERARNIDVDRAQAAKKRAEKHVEEAKQKHDARSLQRAQVALRRALNRINVYNTIK